MLPLPCHGPGDEGDPRLGLDLDLGLWNSKRRLFVSCSWLLVGWLVGCVGWLVVEVVVGSSGGS